MSQGLALIDGRVVLRPVWEDDVEPRKHTVHRLQHISVSVGDTDLVVTDMSGTSHRLPRVSANPNGVAALLWSGYTVTGPHSSGDILALYLVDSAGRRLMDLRRRYIRREDVEDLCRKTGLKFKDPFFERFGLLDGAHPKSDHFIHIDDVAPGTTWPYVRFLVVLCGTTIALVYGLAYLIGRLS